MPNRKKEPKRYTYGDLKRVFLKIKEEDSNCYAVDMEAMVRGWTKDELKNPLPPDLNATLRYLGGHYCQALPVHDPAPTLTENLCGKPKAPRVTKPKP